MAIETDKRMVTVLPGDGTIRLKQVPVPELGRGMVRISVKRSLVSPGTHLGGWDNLAKKRKEAASAGEPKSIGYSLSGIVEAVGEGVSSVSVGQRVAAIGAGYALHTDIAVVPHHLCIQVPEEVDFEEASYAMLLATAMHAVRRGTPVIGEYWIVYGLGIVGLLTAQLLKLNGCFVTGIDEHQTRVDLAAEWLNERFYRSSEHDLIDSLKKQTLNHGFDGSVFAFGGEADTAMDQAVGLMKLSPDGHPGGTIVTVGWPKFSYNGLIGRMNNIDLRRASRTGPGYHDEKWERGEDYPRVFVRWSTQSNLWTCLEFVRRGMIDVKSLTTHRIPLESVETEIPKILSKPEEILGVVFTSGDRE
jgi:threonine dehydrogenase-like Zn-dependent dehydrogenase